MRHPPPNPEAPTRPPRTRTLLGLGVAISSLLGCSTQHEIDVKPTHHTVSIEPIYMTVDINLKVQKELDAFYEDVVASADPQPTPGESP